MIIGRFSPLTRALMPFFVGASQISAKRFWFFNVIGAIAWAGLSILLGYAFGASYHAVAGYFGKFAVIAILAAVLIIWGYRFVNMRFHIFARYEVFALLLNLLSLWGLAETIQDAMSHSPFLAGFDVWVNVHLYDKVTHLPLFPAWIVTLGSLISSIGGTGVAVCLGIAIGLYLAFKRKWRSSAIMLLSIASTGIAVGTMKTFFMRVRPDVFMLNVPNLDPSFPSGHSAFAAAFFVIVAYLLAKRIRPWVKRELMIVGCVLAVIVIGLSRLILNVHWASDVIAGWSLGVFLATASILLVRYVSVLVVNKSNRKAVSEPVPVSASQVQ
jgi:membrane-associated phospholipid phosphatase